MKLYLLLILTASSFINNLFGQNLYDGRHSVILEATTIENPPLIKLTWLADTVNLGYSIYRKFKDEKSWGNSLVALGPSSTSWTDTSIQVGIAYEYRVEKSMPKFVEYEGPIKGYGYIYAGIKIPPTHFRGDCLIVIDSSIAPGIETEIHRLMEDLEADGWRPSSLRVDRNDSVTRVKASIQDWASKDSVNQKALFLLGHVPVPYSGNIAPDGHVPDHQGAWPADGYYANLDGIWTDSVININIPPGTRNDNLPGDGKFDNRFFPTAVKLQVGRVDLWGMTKFNETEVELLRRYLDKDHAWRKGRIPVVERGLIDNNFPQFAEGVCQAGWKNFAPMFGIKNVHDVPYRSSLQKDSYLWSFGAGGGGPESASDISSTTNYVSDSLLTQFTFLFGSYFGDWDVPNNFLRAPLASRSGLVCTWGTRPNWQVHHMALGEHIGYSTQLTMNNTSLYRGGYSQSFVHIALMGDPTLRMHILPPVEQLTIQQAALHVKLEWQDTSKAIGYYIYKKTYSDSTFQLLNNIPVSTSTYIDSCVEEGFIEYMVRSVELRTSASGSYYNLSSGVTGSIDADPNPFKARALFSVNQYFDKLSTTNLSINANNYLWDFGDGSFETLLEPGHLYLNSKDYTLCLTARDGCWEDINCQTLSIVSSLPTVDARVKNTVCHGDSSGSISLSFTGGSPIQFVQWINRPDTNRVLTNLPLGSYSCRITSETGRSDLHGPYLVGEPAPWDLQAQVKMPTPGQSDGFVSVDPMGGCPPYSFLWDNGQINSRLQNIAAGIYCVRITDCIGCMDSLCLEVKESTGTKILPGLLSSNLYPSPTHNNLFLDLQFDFYQKVRLKINSLFGQTLYDELFEGSHIYTQWDVRDFPVGVYFLQIESQGKYYFKTWIKN